MGLSKEEKKALKLAKKLEKARVALEAHRQRKRDELMREVAAHHLAHKAVNKVWQLAMARIKEPEFRQNLEVMLHTFDRAMDKKDYLIDYTVYLRDLANHQYQRTIATFCSIVDGIIGRFLDDLEELAKQNEIKTKIMLATGEEEKRYILEYQRKAETHMNILLYHSHEIYDALAWNTRGENFVKQDEDKGVYLAVREHLRAILEGTYTDMWDQFKETIKTYVLGTAENQKQVRILRKKEKLMTDIIAAQARKILTYGRVIRRLRVELVAYESGAKQAGFRDRRDRHRNACFILKKNMVDGLATDEKQMNTLVMASYEATKHFEDAYKKCEKILRMAALCRKHETLYEKVLPCKTNTFEENGQKTNVRHKQPEDFLVTNAIASSSGLTKLWYRISQVELSKRALCNEKIALEQEYTVLIGELERMNNSKLGPETSQCTCLPRTSKRDLVQPHAVDGSLEARKIFRYY